MKKIVPILILVLFIAGSAWAAEKVHWAMDDGSGTNVADSVGSNDGTLGGTSPPTWNGFGSGLPGGGTDSLHFDGGGKMTVAYDTAFDQGSGTFTVSFDIRGSATSAQQYIFSHGDPVRYEAYVWGGQFYMEYDAHDGGVNDGKTDLVFDESLVLTGEWVHVDMVVDRAGGGTFGTMEFFVDGVLIDKEFMNSAGSFDNTYDFILGGGPYLDKFIGDMDNFVIHDTRIPEPATFAVLALGAIGFLVARRRR